MFDIDYCTFEFLSVAKDLYDYGQEVLVRDKEGVIEAEIFPDYEYAEKKKIKDMQAALQEIIDNYNNEAPLYKRVYGLIIREVEFEKNTTKKIKRF